MPGAVAPLDQLISWLDSSRSARPRWPGCSASPRCRRTGSRPAAASGRETDRGRTSAMRTAEGRDVLEGRGPRGRPGERLRHRGAAAPASRRSAGCWPASTAPTYGGSPSAARPLPSCRWRSCAAEVALVTQEHHVFLGTLRENLTLARPTRPTTQCAPRSPRSTPGLGARLCRTGLDTWSARRAVQLSPAQAQQLALARLVLADPHTLSSTRRPR